MVGDGVQYVRRPCVVPLVHVHDPLLGRKERPPPFLSHPNVLVYPFRRVRIEHGKRSVQDRVRVGERMPETLPVRIPQFACCGRVVDDVSPTLIGR